MYCVDKEWQWDEVVYLVLFAVHESIQETLGFTPFEVVFGQTIRGPLKLLKEAWLDEDTTMNLLDHVSNLCKKLHTATELANDNLKSAQRKMWYDKKALK